MKEKCYALRTSILILILGGIFTSILYFIEVEDSFSKIKDFSIMILGGATSSVVATSIIYCEEYNVTKRSTLEQYYISAIKVLNQFSKLEYFHTDEPIELVMEYFTEKSHNDGIITLREQAIEIGDSNILDRNCCHIRHCVRDRWCKELRPYYTELEEKMDAERFNRFLIEEVEKKSEEYLKNMNSIIDLYIKLAETSYTEVESIYGQICYFIPIKCKKQIYNDIHETLRTKLWDIKGTSGIHFKGYRNGEIDNTAAMLCFLIKLQDKIYRVDFKEDEEYVHTKVYKEFYYTMNKKLEKFRAEIYGTEPEYEKEQCCCSYTRKVDDISKINNHTIL